MRKVLVLTSCLLGCTPAQFLTEIKGTEGGSNVWEKTTSKLFDIKLQCGEEYLAVDTNSDVCMEQALGNDYNSRRIWLNRQSRMIGNQFSKEDVLCDEYFFFGSMEYEECIDIAVDNPF